VEGSCEPGNESLGSIKVKSTHTLHESTKGGGGVKAEHCLNLSVKWR
jgi:hypothetical protein